MRIFSTIAVTLAAFIPFMTITPASAEYSCHECIPTIIQTIMSSGSHGVPDPTRQGNLIGHFDANGVPQSIVTPADSYLVTTETCEPRMRFRKGD